MEPGYLAELRKDATEDLYASGETATLIHMVPVPGGTGLGGQKYTPVVGLTVPCEVAPLMVAKEGPGGGQRVIAENALVVIMPWDTAVNVKDRVRIDSTGKIFEVTGTNEDTTNRHNIRVTVTLAK